MRALWIADAHLSDPDSKPYRALLELLERSPREIDTLVLLGDLFEVWLGDHPALLARHRTLLNVLAGVRALGKGHILPEREPRFPPGKDHPG
jgi:UDP-2,3-diacylglucosamine hydrolase